MLGFNAFVADTDEEAQLLATSLQQAFVKLRTGQPTSCRRRERGYADELRWKRGRYAAANAVGLRDRKPGDRAAAGEAFVERTKPDELMVTAQIFDHRARLRSFELLMEAMSDLSPALT